MPPKTKDNGPKRKRAPTVGSSVKPVTKRTNTVRSNPTTASNSEENELTAPTHSYGTRRTNNPHPARSVGLEKRTQAQISEEASVRKGAQHARAEAKRQDEEEKAQREAAGFKAIANALDYRSRQGSDNGVGHSESSTPSSVASADSLRSRQKTAGSKSKLAAAAIGASSGHDEVSYQPDSDASTNLDIAPIPAGQTEKPKPTLKDKRAQESVRIWTNVSNLRTSGGAQSIRNTNADRHMLKPTTGRLTTSVPPYAGLSATWQSKLAEKGSTVASGGLSDVTSTIAYRQTKSNRQLDEAIGGFDDSDVMAKVPKAGRSSKRSVATRQLAAVEDDLPVPVGPIVRKPRAAKSEVAPHKSIAIKNLPRLLQDDLNPSSFKRSRIIDTLADFYGRQTDPYDLDHQEGEVFSKILDLTLRYLYPDVDFKVTKGDQVYTKARQSIYEVRARMWKTATAYMKGRMKGLGAEEVRKIVTDAKSQYGELYYADGSAKREPYQSECVLRVFAEHLKAINASVLTELEFDGHVDLPGHGLRLGFPQGALVLAICAVHRAFNLYKSGTYQSTTEQFSEVNVKGSGDKPEDWTKMWRTHSKAVTQVLMRPDKEGRFMALINKASEYNHSRGKGKTRAIEISSDDEEIFEVTMSSSPVALSHAQFDDDDEY